MTVLNHADAIYLGSRKVDKVMLGAVQVWPPVAGPAGVSVDYVSAGAQGQTSTSGNTPPRTPLVFAHTVGAGASELLIFVHAQPRQSTSDILTWDVTVDGVPAALLAGHNVNATSLANLAVFRVASPAAGVREVKVYAKLTNSSGYGRVTLCTAASVSLKGTSTLDADVVSGPASEAPAQLDVSTPVVQVLAHIGAAGGFGGYTQDVLWQAAYSAGNGYAMIVGANLAVGGTADFECSGPVGGSWTGIAVELAA